MRVRAIMDHYKRVGIEAKRVEKGSYGTLLCI